MRYLIVLSSLIVSTSFAAIEPQEYKPNYRAQEIREIHNKIMSYKNLAALEPQISIQTNDNGQIVLKGQVPSESNKRALEEIAIRVAGSLNVKNEIKVETTIK